MKDTDFETTTRELDRLAVQTILRTWGGIASDYLAERARKSVPRKEMLEVVMSQLNEDDGEGARYVRWLSQSKSAAWKQFQTTYLSLHYKA